MATYSEKLKDPRWQRKRLEVLNDCDFTCSQCGDKETTLHVHHFVYRKELEPWEYSLADLTAYCENCHKFTHSKNIPDEIKQAINDISYNPVMHGQAIRTFIKFSLNKYE